MFRLYNRLLLISALLMLLAKAPLIAQPANDNCANAITLTVDAACVSGTTLNATTQGGEATGWTGSAVSQTVWYKFVATATAMDVWVDNSWSPNTCELASAVWTTGTCIPTGTPTYYKGISTPTDVWHHLSGLTVSNTYLIQIGYRTNGSCNSGGNGQSFCVGVYNPSTTAGYNHPTVGLSTGASVGACATMASSGQYYDDGGASSNHANSITTGVYRVFCPDAVGYCTRVTLNYVNMTPTSDYLRIRNGASRNGTIILNADMTTPATQITSTDSSGCLTFRMYSDASTNRAGWNISLGQVACAYGPNGIDNNDCNTSTRVCANATYDGNSTGPGLVAEACSSCQHSENYSSWHSFQITTAGTLQFLINPLDNQDDYDFTLYGPATDCNSLGNARRCSFGLDASNGNTGLLPSETDSSENASGNGYVDTMRVTAGSIYYLVVNNTEADTDAQDDGYTIDFTGTTATFNCGFVLPVALTRFKAEEDQENDGISLNWSTATEINNDYFLLEKSQNGIDFIELMKIKGAGTTSTASHYYAFDASPIPGINYYRLKQFDVNGAFTYSDITSAVYNSKSPHLNVFPTLVSEQVNLLLNGIYHQVLDITIFNMFGNIVMKTSVEITGDNTRFQIDVMNLERGFYTLTALSRQNYLTGKFVKK